MTVVDIDKCSSGIKSVRSSGCLRRGIPIDRGSWQPARHSDVKNDIPQTRFIRVLVTFVRDVHGVARY